MAPSEGDDELFGTGGEDLRSIYAVEIAKFRKRVGPILQKYPRYDTDFALLRWLRGCKYDIGTENTKERYPSWCIWVKTV
ncbi:unnamed protein product [Gongylonema pulchrum]|uniref:DUF772 domain-containing protein n=1 Tax=Gongylonema pulchrum TaxID=637853 RepID=A0A183CZF8_9BILA|nr:unnamed protein product [Gongylonema pulchrum]